MTNKYNRKKRLKRFLFENEIIFKTILMFSLSVAGLLVSVASCAIAYNQLHLNSEIAKQNINEKLPFFRLSSEKKRYKIYGDEDEYVDGYKYTLKNVGGDIKTMHMDSMPYGIIKISIDCKGITKTLYYKLLYNLIEDEYKLKKYEKDENANLFFIESGNYLSSYLFSDINFLYGTCLEKSIKEVYGDDVYVNVSGKIFLNIYYYDYKNEYHEETLQLHINDMYDIDEDFCGNVNNYV